MINHNFYKRPDTGEVQAVIKVSRGCPFHCFFCLATPVSGAEIRTRSPENIVEEIKECINKYNIRNFIFWADIFNYDKKWVSDLCNLIIANNLNITWSANTRADTIDEEITQLMYRAGCRLVSIGAESGSQHILNNIGKNITLDDIRLAVKILKKYNMKIYTYFIIGLPWETEYTVEDTIDFAIELDSDFTSFYTAAPLPGTKFYNYAVDNNLINSNTSFKDAYFVPTIRSHELTKEQIFKLHKQAVRKFYLRPSYIFKTLLKIKSKNELKNYIKAGLKILTLK